VADGVLLHIGKPDYQRRPGAQLLGWQQTAPDYPVRGRRAHL
jgi:hypothetical protein